MTYDEWFKKSNLYPTERNAGSLAWKAGTAAERKRILGLMESYFGSIEVWGHLRRAIEHPEPDAVETK